MRDAIETLNKGASQQPHLSMIAMALSGNIDILNRAFLQAEQTSSCAF